LEPEICSVTGGEAYARFRNGLGSAWYGSVHDADYMVDLGDEPFEGPVCDEVITEAIAEGRIVVYGNGLSGEAPSAIAIGMKAAMRLFGIGADRQRAALVDSAAGVVVQESDVYFKTGSNIYGVARDLVRPAWHSGVEDILLSVQSGREAVDFLLLGRLYILGEHAAGRQPTMVEEQQAARATWVYENRLQKARIEMMGFHDSAVASILDEDAGGPNAS
jgi:hypothetical protein